MWALIAFIALGITVATLIEINERIKAKKKKQTEQVPDASCKESCSDCDLLSVCEKDKTKS